MVAYSSANAKQRGEKAKKKREHMKMFGHFELTVQDYHGHRRNKMSRYMSAGGEEI